MIMTAISSSIPDEPTNRLPRSNCGSWIKKPKPDHQGFLRVRSAVPF
jgi:hypothetical protein